MRHDQKRHWAPNHRQSNNDAWPIKRADNLTPAQVRPNYQPKSIAA